VSKADVRVDVYGTIDELISALGFARSICRNVDISALTKSIQRELFSLGSAIATAANGPKPKPVISDEMVERLTTEVHRVEALPGILADWSIPGEDPASAAYDVARTICRRAERLVVGFAGSGAAEDIQPNVLRYLNRLSDLTWLFGRQIELEIGVDSKLREGTGPRWSRAW
jgi:cob(I)alamin adenosyltransferase